MKRINCLYMEDSDADYNLLSEVLKLTLQGRVTLDFKRTHNPDQTRVELERHGNDYQLFIADIMFPDPNNPSGEQQPDGLIAVEKAATFPRLAIAALSVADRKNPEIRPKFDKATSGFGLYLDKDAVRRREYPKENLRNDLLHLLESKQHLSYSSDELNEIIPWQKNRQLKLDALIEIIGHENLVNLAKLAAPDCSSYVPHYVAPGYSGAVVLRLTCSRPDSTAVDANVLLKCSRDRAKLKLEIERCPKQREPVSDLYVLPDSEAIHSYNGWFATVWRFREDAQTLLSWLLNGQTEASSTGDTRSVEKVDSVLDRLFLHGLNKDYRRGKAVTDKSAAEALTPNVLGRFRVSESLKLLQTIINAVTGSGAIDVTPVESFLIDELIAGRPISKVKPGSYICTCHGDLHTRNILISDKEQPLLIDPARRMERHWASDVSRLCADLWVSAWDAGAQSHVWDKLPAWTEAARSWVYGLDSADLDLSGTPRDNWWVVYALLWVRRKLSEIFAGAPASEWEFRLALAVEFLNMSGYETIPTPKRCLSVLIANEILSNIGTSLPWVS